MSFRDQSADNFALRIACRLMVVAPRLERDRGKNDPKKFGDRHVGLRPPGDDMISRRFDQRFPRSAHTFRHGRMDQIWVRWIFSAKASAME